MAPRDRFKWLSGFYITHQKMNLFFVILYLLIVDKLTINMFTISSLKWSLKLSLMKNPDFVHKITLWHFCYHKSTHPSGVFVYPWWREINQNAKQFGANSSMFMQICIHFSPSLCVFQRCSERSVEQWVGGN